MRFALSTNWCNRRLLSGEAIADAALELGFDALELGFHTTQAQVEGFRRRLDRMPVGSVHAFCPVPISAPCGYPELYLLADADDEARRMARLQVLRNIRFAADIGADAVVLHAGRVPFSGWLRPLDSQVLSSALAASGGNVDATVYRRLLGRALRRREKRGLGRLDAFRFELDAIVPELGKLGVTLALENLPYLEGFPDERELRLLLESYRGSNVRGWFDTGHNRVRECHGWTAKGTLPDPADFAGMHLNDVKDFCDDHFAPGGGNVDFAALGPFARAVRHVVLEPSPAVSAADLKRGLALVRGLWSE